MDGHLRSFLVDWTVSFFKNKDLLAKKIASIEKNKDGFDISIKFKDKWQYVVVEPQLNDIDTILRKFNGKDYFTIVTLNSSKNLDIVVKNWQKLASFKLLSIMFVNPVSETDKKWVIFPHTHSMVADGASLELGLKSMFGMVEPIEEGRLLEIIKG